MNLKCKEGGMIPATEEAQRFNSGKPQLSMILEAFEGLSGVAEVLKFGAEKYTRGNWQKPMSLTELMDSMLRHQSAYLSGQDLDPESKLHHLFHVACNAIFAAQHIAKGTGIDDRSCKKM